MHTVDFSYFSDLDQIFQTFHFNRSVAQSSTNLCPKIYLICSKLESVISFEIREDQTRMSRIQMFHYELWPPSARRHAVQRRRTRQKKKKKKKKKKTNTERFFLFRIRFPKCNNDHQERRRRCTTCVRADGGHIESFVTFDFDPSFISSLETDSALKRIK